MPSGIQLPNDIQHAIDIHKIIISNDSIKKKRLDYKYIENLASTDPKQQRSAILSTIGLIMSEPRAAMDIMTKLKNINV